MTELLLFELSKTRITAKLTPSHCPKLDSNELLAPLQVGADAPPPHGDGQRPPKLQPRGHPDAGRGGGRPLPPLLPQRAQGTRAKVLRDRLRGMRTASPGGNEREKERNRDR